MRILLPLIAMSMAAAMVCSAGESMGNRNNGDSVRSWAELTGKPVDIAPWAYEWRADVAVQAQPEAYFIPRRLDRIDKVYRTAYEALPQSELKSIYYDMPSLLKPLLPKPEGQLQAGLLWTGGVADYRVELYWPAEIPSLDSIEVRAYPTAFGWFGWTVDQVVSNPTMSEDRRTWTYKSDPTAKMDAAYSAHIPAATEMVAVFSKDAKSAIPTIRVVGPSLGAWKRMDVEIEWGFQAGAKQTDFDGRLEPSVAVLGPVSPLADDKGTTLTEEHRWQSRAAGDARRGIVVPLLYAPQSCPGLDSRVTVWGKSDGFTFRVKDLEKGSILIPEQGVFITRVGSGQTAQAFTKELAAKGLKSIRQMTREHREAASWDELMQEVRLWACPEGTDVPPFPQVVDPPMQVQVPDQRWTDAWRVATDQMLGHHMWGNLAHEVGRVAYDMELVGLHEGAAKVYEYFLESPGVKSDGDYADGKGSLEWARSMRHDMGYSHEGTHSSTGRLLFAMAERYLLTGDKEWFEQRRVRLQAAADWIIRERESYMKDVPNRKDLMASGLMPPCMLGDYAIPACDWHWYYVDNALSLQGLQRFSDALMEFDPKAARRYSDEAKAFRKDLRRAAEHDAALAPVRLGRDGMYHSYIPRMAYARGLTGPELGAPHFPDADLFWGSLLLGEPNAALDANDYRIVDTLDVMEELGTSVAEVRKREEARKAKGLPAEDAWFWKSNSFLPKISHNSNIYLLEDDVPNFLRFWMNSYAGMVGANGKLWEHWHLGQYADCDTPDTMTAGWFLENYRNMLLMEDGQSLWIARATPRVWLEQGKKIAVRNAPTHFGVLAYEIVSDVDNGKISATIEIPSRNPIKSVILRFRHPKATPVRSVTVNGKSWKAFDADRETIKLTGVTGKVIVVATY